MKAHTWSPVPYDSEAFVRLGVLPDEAPRMTVTVHTGGLYDSLFQQLRRYGVHALRGAFLDRPPARPLVLRGLPLAEALGVDTLTFRRLGYVDRGAGA